MIEWGILGTGSIAKIFARAIKTSKKSRLFGVASRSARNAKEFSSVFDCSGFAGYHELINHKNVDAIYIATPHPFHFDLAFKSLEKEKSVLCEKPLAMNATETMILIHMAKKNNLLLMEAFMYRMHAQTNKIKEIIKSEFSKRPVSIEASFGFQANVNKKHRLLNPILGGGSIMDVGCYPLSMARMIAGLANRKDFLDPIEFEVESELNEQGIDLFSKAYLRFEGNSNATISSSINRELENSVKVTDGRKTLFIQHPWHCGEHNNRKSEIILEIHNQEKKIIEVESKDGIYTNEINHFTDILKDSKIESNAISHSDSYGNAMGLDIWRKKAGVKYVYDVSENKASSFFNPLLLQKENLIPQTELKGLDKKLSRLVFGCDNQLDSNHAFAMFDHFYSLGGNVFDTAYIYNGGKGDEYLGRWLKSRGLNGKTVILGKGAHTPDCYPSSIRTQLLESLSRLKIDCLDIYCLHRDNPEVPVGEFIDALEELKREGLIKMYGASNWSLERFRESHDYSISAMKQPFSLLSNNFSLARMVEPVWPGCKSCSDEHFKKYLIDENIPVFPWSSQSRGFFLDKKEFEGHQHSANPNKAEQERVWANDENLQRRGRCFSIAKEKGFEPIEIALAFALNQEFSTFPLIGPRNFFEIESSVKALSVELNKTEIDWLDLQ